MQNTVEESGRTLYKRLLTRFVLGVLGVVGLFFLLPRVLHLLLPFVIAFIVASILNPFVNKINQRFGVSRRIIALVLDLLAFLIISTLIGFLAYSVITEAVSLATSLQQHWGEIVGKLDGIGDSFAWLMDILPPQVMDIFSGFEESIMSSLQSLSKNLLGSVISGTTSMTTKTGSFFINFVIAILAAYFIVADYNNISAVAKKYVHKRAVSYFSMLKGSVITALGGYLKSQLLLALFAFLFMLVALGIYGQPYALLIALFLGFIDLLPIVGTIAVMLPWGVIEFVSGNTHKGIFLIVVGVVFFLLRKVVEPKIVGSQTGLHPLVALMSTYVGLQFSGVWGAVLGPVVLMLILSVVKSGIFDSTIADLKSVGRNIAKALTK